MLHGNLLPRCSGKCSSAAYSWPLTEQQIALPQSSITPSLLHFHAMFKVLLLASDQEMGLFYLAKLKICISCAVLSPEQMEAKIPCSFIIAIKR